MKQLVLPLLAPLLLILICTGCGGDGATPGAPENAVRGVSENEIVIGSWGPQTGPAALWGSVPRGAAVYFQMINDEGGINGRKIKFIHRDDGYQPPRTKAAVKEMVERHGVFAFVGGVGTAPGMAVKDYIVEHKIPWVSPSSGSTHWAFPPSENIFATYPLYCDEAAILTDYAVTQLGKKKIAFFYQNDDYGKGGLYGAKLALEKHGLSLVATASAEVTDTDLSSQVLRLRASGAEVVIAWIMPKQAQILLSTSAKLGFKPQWMSSSTLSDYGLMHEITKGNWEGVIFCSFGLMESDAPRMQKYRAAWKKYAPQERWGPFFVSGFLYAEPLVEGLRRCGDDLTYARFIREMETLNGFAGSGAPIHFGPNQRQGRRTVRLFQCINEGEARALSDWLQADVDIKRAIELLEKGE